MKQIPWWFPVICVATLLAALLAAILLFPVRAHASHEAGAAANAIQTLASNADVVVAAGTQAALGGGCGVANPAREEADVQVTSGSARIGDSSTSTNSGINLSASNPPFKLEITSAIYAWSDAGAVISCTSINR
jgi:hypothetical protein